MPSAWVWLNSSRYSTRLFAAELLTVEGDRFANTVEANYFLVRGGPAYMGGVHPLYADLWDAALQTAESIRNWATTSQARLHSDVP